MSRPIIRIRPAFQSRCSGTCSGVTLRHAALDINSAADRVHYAAELGQQPVSSVLDNPPTVLSDFGIEQETQVVLEPGVRAFLV
jgi:hypothetical protein